jgi:hypothetical protein
MIIKTFEEFVNESFSGREYGLTMTVNTKHGKFTDRYSFDTIETARKFMINWLDKHPGTSIEYFDICSGYNYSDPDCLEIWGGDSGYFANVANGGYKYKQQFSYSELKQIEKCEVDIMKYLEKNKQT